MRAEDLRSGLKVRIVAQSEFFSFVDGWTGEFVGFHSGYPHIVCKREDGIKHFFVPPDELEPVHG